VAGYITKKVPIAMTSEVPFFALIATLGVLVYKVLELDDCIIRYLVGGNASRNEGRGQQLDVGEGEHSDVGDGEQPGVGDGEQLDVSEREHSFADGGVHNPMHSRKMQTRSTTRLSV